MRIEQLKGTVAIAVALMTAAGVLGGIGLKANAAQQATALIHPAFGEHQRSHGRAG